MSPVDASASKMEVLRKSYNAVSRVCINMLVHALRKVRVSRVRRQPTKEPTLSIVKVYSRAVKSMLNLDAFKARFVRWSAQASSTTLLWCGTQCVAFAHHIAVFRGQP